MNTLGDEKVVRSTRCREADEAAQAIHGARLEISILGRARSDWHILRVHAGDSVLVAQEMPAPFSAICALEKDTVSFAIGSAETGTWMVNGRSADSRSVICLSDGAEWDSLTDGPVNWLALRVPRSTFERHFEIQTGRSYAPAGRVSVATPAEADNSALRDAFFAAARVANTDPHLLREAGVRATLEKSLLERVIRAVSCPAPAERLSYEALGVRARDYLKAHSASAVFQSDLCDELGIGERSLRRLFDEHFGVSPARYLRLRRLNQARRALLYGESAYKSVTEVGVRYGFFDLGRFAADYRELFRELPSATLRRVRSEMA
jgi:AraC family ethanolamine operon transcriptional activator